MSLGSLVVAKKRKPIEAVPPADDGDGRGPLATILTLKGTRAQADWFAKASKVTRISQSNLIRLAVAQWAERHGAASGLEPFPELDDAR